jgi:hypothetical protein
MREEALQLLRKGNHSAAVQRLAELERLAPADPEYPQRSAECHRALGNRTDEIAALGRAAERYADQGAYGKAIALHRMILGLDPGHEGSAKRVAELVQGQAPRVHIAPAKVSAAPVAVTDPHTSASTTTASGTPARLRLEEVLRKRRAEQLRPHEDDDSETIAPPESEDWFALADLLEPEDQTFPEVEITSLRLTDAPESDVDLELPSDARAS